MSCFCAFSEGKVIFVGGVSFSILVLIVCSDYFVLGWVCAYFVFCCRSCWCLNLGWWRIFV